MPYTRTGLRKYGSILPCCQHTSYVQIHHSFKATPPSSTCRNPQKLNGKMTIQHILCQHKMPFCVISTPLFILSATDSWQNSTRKKCSQWIIQAKQPSCCISFPKEVRKHLNTFPVLTDCNSSKYFTESHTESQNGLEVTSGDPLVQTPANAGSLQQLHR